MPCMARLPFWGAPSDPPAGLMPRAWPSCGHILQQTPHAETGCRASHGCKWACSEHTLPPAAPLQLPKPHLLGRNDVSSQPALAVPTGCSGGVASCLHASMGWLLLGQGEDRAGGQQQEWTTTLPSVRGAHSIPMWCLGAALSFLLSHGSRPRLKLRRCSRAAQALQLSCGGWSRVFPFWLHILLYKASKGLLLKLRLPVSNKQSKPQAHYMQTHYTPGVDSWQERDSSKPGMSPNPTSNKPSAPLGPRDHAAEWVS